MTVQIFKANGRPPTTADQKEASPEQLADLLNRMQAAADSFGTKDANKRLFRESARWLTAMAGRVVELQEQLAALQLPPDDAPSSAPEAATVG